MSLQSCLNQQSGKVTNQSGLLKTQKMAKSKDSNISLEDEVKVLKKHMGGLVATIKDLKKTVEALDKKVSANEKEEIKEISENQKVVDEMIAANANAIKRLEGEIKKLGKSKSDEVVGNIPTEKDKTVLEVPKYVHEAENSDKETKQKAKVCRYFNRGYCKYKFKCRFFHAEEVCEEFVKTQNCTKTACKDRHPKQCKWFNKGDGCKRESECKYLHVTLAHDELKSYKCEGCKDVWNDQSCVVEHIIDGRQFYLCLNCNDWIHFKADIFTNGWTLLDAHGNLKTNI